MTGKARVLLICILLLIVSGCGSAPVLTEVFETPTPYQEVSEPISATPNVLPTISFLPTNTAIVFPTSTAVSEPLSSSATAVVSEPLLSLPTTAVTAVMPADFSPILYGKKYDANMFFLLLGGVQGSTWLSPEQAAAQFGGEWEYDVHPFTRGSFQVRGHAPEFSPVSGRNYFLRTDATFNEFGMVGVLHGWPVRQGNAQELSADTDVYRQVVVDWLTAEGISAPELDVLRIFRVDLEGDGMDEIFINATHLDESQHTTRSGDYSIILMRKVAGSDTVTLPIAGDVYHSQELEITYPRTYALGNFIDLDRDGVLEVVVDYQRWEGFGAIIYQVNGQNVIKVLER